MRAERGSNQTFGRCWVEILTVLGLGGMPEMNWEGAWMSWPTSNIVFLAQRTFQPFDTRRSIFRCSRNPPIWMLRWQSYSKSHSQEASGLPLQSLLSFQEILDKCYLTKRKMWKCNGPKNPLAVVWNTWLPWQLWSSLKKCIAKELSCKHAGSHNLNQKGLWVHLQSRLATYNVAKDTRLSLAWNCQWIWDEVTSSCFCVWEKTIRKLTNVNAWALSKFSVKTNEFQRWPKMRHIQSAASVAETKTEAVAKGVNSAGAARGGVTLFWVPGINLYT